MFTGAFAESVANAGAVFGVLVGLTAMIRRVEPDLVLRAAGFGILAGGLIGAVTATIQAVA